MNLHKLILSNRYLRYTPLYYWYRLIIHLDCHLDDRYVYQDFWNAICEGQTQMIEDDKWLQHFGAKPQTMYFSERDYDALVKAINEPPQYNENLARLMNRPAPWENQND